MKSGCPTPMHCHRSPPCQDGCEDPEAIKNYKETLRMRAKAMLDESRGIFNMYEEGQVTQEEAYHMLKELLTRKDN